MDFNELRTSLFRLHADEEYRKGLELLYSAGDQYPENTSRIAFWKACLHSLLNETDLAIQILENTMDEDHWWHEDQLRFDTDLKDLQELPKFRKILEKSKQFRLKHQSKIEPEIQIFEPSSPKNSLATLIALHGRGSTGQIAAEKWKSATDLNLTIAIPQSSQLFGPTSYCWDDQEITLAEIKAHIENISADPLVTREKIILGGSSQGGEMVIKLTLSGAIPVLGFIAVVPSIGFDEIDKLLPFFPEAKQNGIRGYIITGSNDPRKERAIKLHALLQEHKIPCELEMIEGMGHEFPAEFDKSLQRATNYILNN